MKLSIIIPTFRPSEYIRECLDSLGKQSFPHEDFEVIIVLNGEKDPYYDYVGKIISEKCKDLTTKLIYTDTKGVSNARNIAVDISSGDYLAFIDDDDYVSETYLEELYSKAAEDTIVQCCPKAFRDGDGEVSDYRPAEIFRQLSCCGKQSVFKARKLLHITCMKLIPRKIIGDRRYDTRFSVGEDTLMMFRISDKIRHVDFTSEGAVYFRRFRQGAATDTFSGSRYTDKLNNSFRLILQYTRIYLSGIRRYSFRFYITRVWGALHSIIRL